MAPQRAQPLISLFCLSYTHASRERASTSGVILYPEPCRAERHLPCSPPSPAWGLVQVVDCFYHGRVPYYETMVHELVVLRTWFCLAATRPLKRKAARGWEVVDARYKVHGNREHSLQTLQLSRNVWFRKRTWARKITDEGMYS